MSTFHLSVKMDNAAFVDDGPGYELGRILQELAERLGDGPLPPATGKLYDYNGNSVGHWEVTGE